MIRLKPCEEPKGCRSSNRSSPSTRRPRRDRWNAAALPMPPSPSTIASYLSVTPADSSRTERAMVRITGAHVYDASPGRFQDLDVVVDGDRIAGVTARGRPGPGEEVLDLSGAYLLPGLIDCHVHLTIRSEDADPGATAARSQAAIARYARMAAERTVRAGITSVRDLGGWNFLEMALRDEVLAGRAVGPRMFLAGRLLSIPTPATDYYPGMYEVVREGTTVAEGVRRQLDHGADVIKVMATGTMLSPEDEDAGAVQLTREELREAVEAASAHDVPVAAHAHARDGIDNAVEAGVASI